jgi:hypothetical protein
MCKITGSADLRASLQELVQAGSPVDLSVADSDRENEKLEIIQVGGVHESSIFELPNGRAGYRIAVLVTNQTSKTIYTSELELRTSREDNFFQWLSPVRIPFRNRRKRNTSYQAYLFPGPSGPELPYDHVLNHILGEGQGLPPKRPIEGWLLAVGGRMPAELRHGQWLDDTLSIIGADHTEYTQDIRLWTERLEARPKAMERRSNLFGEPLNSNARDSVRVPSLESRIDAHPHHLQEPPEGGRPVGDRALRNQEVR